MFMATTDNSLARTVTVENKRIQEVPVRTVETPEREGVSPRLDRCMIENSRSSEMEVMSEPIWEPASTAVLEDSIHFKI